MHGFITLFTYGRRAHGCVDMRMLTGRPVGRRQQQRNNDGQIPYWRTFKSYEEFEKVKHTAKRLGA